MAYRNKTYVCFASEDITQYWMMSAWKANKNIDFNFYDAHDLANVRDTSQPDTVRRRLRERLANTKQAVLLVGDKTRSVAANPDRLLYYELEVLNRLRLPIVVANLNQSREIQRNRMPTVLAGDYYTISVSFQPKIIQFALDEYVPVFHENHKAYTPKWGPHFYKPDVYEKLGLQPTFSS
jgi:hypothetical protein